jgi:serine/threonine-protein kinase
MALRAEPRALRVGRYLIGERLGAGGMASVHVGRIEGAAGFQRTVAIKRLHAAMAAEPDFVKMLIDEAHLASHIHHPNVVATLDVVSDEGELILVLDYVHGESLALLRRLASERGGPPTPGIAAAIAVDVLYGLKAAHDAVAEDGTPLGLVHRDVSPHNILVGLDGVARVSDFGIAKAAGRLQTTRDGAVKGKIRYMAPEQLAGERVGRAADIYAVGVVLWEMLTGEPLFDAENDAATFGRVLEGKVAPPSRLRAELSVELDAVALQALARRPGARFTSARAMAEALEAVVRRASPGEVGAWVERLAGDRLAERASSLRSGGWSMPRIRPTSIRTSTATASPGPSEAEPPAGSTNTATTTRVGPQDLPMRRSAAKPILAAAALALCALAYVGWTSDTPERLAGAHLAAALEAARTRPRRAESVVGPPSTAPAEVAPPPGQPSAPGASRAGNRAHATASAVSSVAPLLQPDCKELYWVDEDGIRRVKPECVD